MKPGQTKTQSTSSLWRVIIVVFTVLVMPSAHAQFRDLHFEQANPVIIPGSPYYPQAVTPASALPFWTASVGGLPVDFVVYNDITLDAASIDLIGPGNMFGPSVIDGNYSVYLQPGTSFSGTGSYTASISQVGTIPSNERSLTFDGWQMMGATPFTISFAGNVLTPILLSTDETPSGQPYNVYGVDISAYAGQTGLLDFTVYPGHYNSLLLDDISLSPNVVPEPSPILLTGIGGLILMVRRKFCR